MGSTQSLYCWLALRGPSLGPHNLRVVTHQETLSIIVPMTLPNKPLLTFLCHPCNLVVEFCYAPRTNDVALNHPYFFSRLGSARTGSDSEVLFCGKRLFSSYCYDVMRSRQKVVCIVYLLIEFSAVIT